MPSHVACKSEMTDDRRIATSQREVGVMVKVVIIELDMIASLVIGQ
jgi:hypothetical protein